MEELKENDVVTIIGKRWFEKVNGNTYHSCIVYVNGDFIGFEDFDYGYGDQYIQTGRKLLAESYILPISIADATWRLKDYGIKLITTVADVNRKKDLVIY